VQLVVIAQEPRPETMDGRLSPPWTLAQAAAVREAALADTLDTVAATPASRRVLALDGEPGTWLPAGFDVVAPRRGSLGNLLFGAFEDCFHVSTEAVVLIGMDTPQVTSDQLLTTEFLLDTSADAVVGATPGGGTWLIGLSYLHPGAFAGVPASDDDTAQAQIDRLRDCGYRVAVTDELVELGDASSAVDLAARLEGTRLAAAVAAAVRDARRR
jgi:glycosyltransferase A (GT-A) superfamily protein (DUF2064 family)